MAALLVALGAVALGCSSAAKTAVSLHTGAGHWAAAGPTIADPTSVAPGPTAPSAHGGAEASVPPKATAGDGAHPGATPAPVKAAAATPTTESRATNPAATGPAPPAPGTYHYNLVSGTSILTTGTTSTTLAIAPQSTLVVSSTGSGTQQWTNPVTTMSLTFNGAGVWLTSEVVALANNTQCSFSGSGVAWPPWPLAVGESFSGQATCGQGQSATTLSLGGQVTGAATMQLDGASVSAFTVRSTMAIGGNLTVVETDWYAPSLRLPVQTTIGVSGGITGYSISTVTTYALTSSRPS